MVFENLLNKGLPSGIWNPDFFEGGLGFGVRNVIVDPPPQIDKHRNAHVFGAVNEQAFVLSAFDDLAKELKVG